MVTLNNHFPNTLLSRIHVRGIMKADKHNTPPQTLSFLHLLPYKNGENGLITLLKTPISTTSTLHSQHFSLSLSLSLSIWPTLPLCLQYYSAYCAILKLGLAWCNGLEEHQLGSMISRFISIFSLYFLAV